MTNQPLLRTLQKFPVSAHQLFFKLSRLVLPLSVLVLLISSFPSLVSARDLGITFTNFSPNGHPVTHFDTNGNALDAHDGYILQVGNTFYLYGTSYSCGFIWQKSDGPFCGFKSYSTLDFVNWNDGGFLFDAQTPIWQSRCIPNGCFRPHVVYNASTSLYVLWINDSSAVSGYQVFTATSPTGPFIEQAPPDLGSSNNGDFSIFVDTDGSAYIIYSHLSSSTADLYIRPLDSSYLVPIGNAVDVNTNADGQSVEAPGMWKRGGIYYIVYSDRKAGFPTGETAWWRKASSLFGPYSASTVLSPTSCAGQTSFVSSLTINGSTTDLYVSDSWVGTGGYEAPGWSNQAMATFFFYPLQYSGSEVLPMSCNTYTFTLELPPSPSSAKVHLDQFTKNQNMTISCNPLEFDGNSSRVQTFTAGRTGLLTDLHVTLFQGPAAVCTSNNCNLPDTDMNVQFVTVDGTGKPASVLSSTTIPKSTLPWGPTFVDVPQNVQVTAGSVYGILLSGFAHSGCYGFAYDDSNPYYPTGKEYFSSNGGSTYSLEANRALMFDNWSLNTTNRVNVALNTNGATAVASSEYANGMFPAASAITGNGSGAGWATGVGGWNDNTSDVYPDWLQVNFADPRTIDEVDVFTLQDSDAHPDQPTLGMHFTLYGITAFQVQYWDGSSWSVVPGGNITGNNHVWRRISFSPLTTPRIRIYVLGSLNSYSRITAVEAYSVVDVSGSPPGALQKSSPANAASAQPLSPALSWGPSSGATSYEYCLDAIGNSICDTVWTTTTNRTAIAGGLSAATKYFWQVRARNTYGVTDADSGLWWSLSTTSTNRVNVASATNGGTASASSFYNAGYAPPGAINGDRKGLGWGNGGGWNDENWGVLPDWLQVDFAGPQTIDEIDVFTLQDNYANPAQPTLGLPFTLYGITAFQVQYWDGSTWLTLPGGNISGNNQVWRQIAFAPITTSRIRVFVNGSVDGFTRIVELEAYSGLQVTPGSFAKTGPANGANGQPLVPKLSWGPSSDATGYEYCVDTTNNNSCDTSWISTSAGTSVSVGGLNAGTYYWQVRSHNSTSTIEADNGTWRSFTTDSSVTNPAANVASMANGAVASASSTYSAAFAPSGAIDGDRKGLAWGNGGGWNDESSNFYPDWLQIDFADAKTISEIDVFTVQDNYMTPVAPTPAMTFTQYGITSFQMQYWNGSDWVNIPNGSITGNTQIWRRISFPALTTNKIRIVITGALNDYSRITELEAY